MTTKTLSFAPDDTAQRYGAERVLLALGFAFLLLNFWALGLLRPAVNHWQHLLAWGACAALGHVALNRFLPQRDPYFYPLTMFLSGWGLVLIDRLAPIFADRQTVWLVLSWGAMLFASCTPYLLRWLRLYRYLLLLLGIALLLSTILLGRNPSGLSGSPQLWLGIGGIFFQPSEALKVILVAFLASYLAEQYPNMRLATSAMFGNYAWLSPRLLGPILLMWGLCVVVLVWQRDLGTASLFFIVFMLLIYVASGQTWLLVGGGSLALLAGWVAYHLFSVVRLRVDIWINPWLESDGRAYQIVQSLMAVGAGGIFGQGVGQGSPTYIPVVHSDFVFSALSEEWGLLGVMAFMICLIVYLWRGLRVAMAHQERSFHALLSTGMVLLIGVQSLMILGGVLKILPLTGVTLPFLSYGGSSLLMCFVVTGILLRLSSEAN